MPRNLGIPNKNPNDLVTAAEFNTLVAAAEDSVVTRADLNIENVSNTSDANKPISIATQAALNNKQNNLGYNPENPNNKVVDLASPNHTTYPTTLAVSNAIFEAISDGDVVIVDADAATKGKIRLAGDLGGTADSPTVPGLATKQDILPLGTTSQYRRGDNTLATLSTDVVAEGTTNKYLTSTEKSKLSGISAGATVNDSDVNLKNRVNHTGTQSADTIIDGTTNKILTATERTKLSGIATGATANSADATLLSRASHTGTQSADTLTDGTTNKVYTATEKTKLAAIPTGATANDTDANLKNRANHTGTQSADTIVDGTTAKVFTTANQTKLSGIATAATANSTDANLRDRSTHTGTQAQSTITNLTTDLAAKQATLVSGTNINTINGGSLLAGVDIAVPILDGDNRLLIENLPDEIPLTNLQSENLDEKFNPDHTYIYDTGTLDESSNPVFKIGINYEGDAYRLLKILGFPIKAETILSKYQEAGGSDMISGLTLFSYIEITEEMTVNEILTYVRLAGVYTAAAGNNLSLYTFNPTTKVGTKVADTGELSGTFFASTGLKRAALTTPYVAQPGLYLIGTRWTASGTPGTVPRVLSRGFDTTNMATIDTGFKLSFQDSTNLAATVDMATLTHSQRSNWGGLN